MIVNLHVIIIQISLLSKSSSHNYDQTYVYIYIYILLIKKRNDSSNDSKRARLLRPGMINTICCKHN